MISPSIIARLPRVLAGRFLAIILLVGAVGLAPARAVSLLYDWRLDGNVNEAAGGTALTISAGAPLTYTASKPAVLGGTQSANFIDETLTATLTSLNTGAADIFSISLWINNSDMTASTLENLFNFGNAYNATSTTGLSLRLDGTKLQFGQNIGQTETFLDVARSGLSNNTWTNLAAVKNGSSSTLYVNGVSQGTVNLTVGTDAVIRFGTRNGISSPNQYSGLMADVRVYQGALTAPEALSLYTTGVPELSTSLLVCSALAGFALLRRRQRGD